MPKRYYSAPGSPLSKVLADRTIKPNGETGCWLWTGAKMRFGHGQIVRKRKHLIAHRVAWELANGPIPDGILVCHKCDVPACCNPTHLFLGTSMDNARDMFSKGRRPSARGERNHSKLTETQVRLIRLDNRTQREIASDYGLAHCTVGAIKRGTKWGWLE